MSDKKVKASLKTGKLPRVELKEPNAPREPDQRQASSADVSQKGAGVTGIFPVIEPTSDENTPHDQDAPEGL